MACIAIRLATQIYDAAGHYQYCDSPVIADASGNLYYINDSGTLFKLGAVESWTVAFNSNGGSACDTKFVATADGKLVKPADPTRDGYTFGGWFTDEACVQAYDFSTSVTADLTLYAKWTKNAVNPGGNGGAGSNGGGGSGTGTGFGTGAGTGTGSGSGSKGGAVAPGHKPTTKTTVSTKTETKDNKSDKKDTDKSDKKDEKKSDKKDSKSDKKSDKKSDSKSDTGAASTTTAKKSSSASEQETSTNPLAIVGVAAGVIGLAIVGMFVFTKRR